MGYNQQKRQKLLIGVNKIGFLRLNRVWLPQVEACCGSQLAGELQQVGRRVVEGQVDVTAAGCDQGHSVVNQGAQVAMVQGSVQPLDHGLGLGILDPVVATVINGQVMVTVQLQHHIGQLTAEALMTLSGQEILLHGKELAAPLFRHLTRQEVNHPVGLQKQLFRYFIKIPVHFHPQS